MRSKGFVWLGDAGDSKSLKCKAGILLIPLLAPLVVLAQTDPIMRAYALQQQGQPANAIAAVRPLIDSGVFHGAELGRAWTVLGVAYAAQNDFREAQHAYELAISVLRPMSENTQDYANAVYDFAGLYRAEGQLPISMDMRLKALRLYQQAGDHCGIARAANAIAGMVLRQGQVKEGKKYIELATGEVKAAIGLNAADLSSIFSTQALFASLNGNTSAAISGHEQALQILKSANEAESPVLAWEYLSLGLAYADANRFEDAVREMRQGLSILDRVWGRNVPQYLEAEIAYSQVLDRSGDHKDAAFLRTADETTLKELRRTQCAVCTISAAAFP